MKTDPDEKRRAYQRDYYQRNKETLKAKRDTPENIERRREYSRKYYAENKKKP